MGAVMPRWVEESGSKNPQIIFVGEEEKVGMPDIKKITLLALFVFITMIVMWTVLERSVHVQRITLSVADGDTFTNIVLPNREAAWTVKTITKSWSSSITIGGM
jgi:hypothetical protein